MSGPLILSIESSCDETGIAVIEGGRRILGNVVASQVAMHAATGGIVPEVAARAHLRWIVPVLDEVWSDAGIAWSDLSAVAVTYGPGLAGSLLVGVNFAKAVAWVHDLPLIGVNHLEGHVYAAWLLDPAEADRPEPVFPLVALVVSGGHTFLVEMHDHLTYRLLGSTVDDAAGEAFDKGANLLGLGYPGGPVIDKTARGGRTDFVRFPRGRQKSDTFRFSGLDPDLCFSFSGLKTSLLYYLKDHPLSADRREAPSLAASYQEAIVDALIEKCAAAVKGMSCVAAVGGVSLNSRLRARLKEFAGAKSIRFVLAEPTYCADNAAMVAGLAGAGQGITGAAAQSIDADPNLELVPFQPA